MNLPWMKWRFFPYETLCYFQMNSVQKNAYHICVYTYLLNFTFFIHFLPIVAISIWFNFHVLRMWVDWWFWFHFGWLSRAISRSSLHCSCCCILFLLGIQFKFFVSLLYCYYYCCCWAYSISQMGLSKYHPILLPSVSAYLLLSYFQRKSDHWTDISRSTSSFAFSLYVHPLNSHS